jgi:hypothetical protein
MSAVWTCHLSCFNCDKPFLVNRVSAEEIREAQAVYPCPHCDATPSGGIRHSLVYLHAVNLPFRKPWRGDLWHYSEHCSGWPVDDYIEIEFPPADEVCRECSTLVGFYKFGSAPAAAAKL